MKTTFEISRTNGRSNAQVMIDYVGDKEPGTLFTFNELAKELSKDTDRLYNTQEVRQVVNCSNNRLLKEKARTLHNVRGVGYRLAYAEEHRMLALNDKRRSDNQMIKGLTKLQHCKLDEIKDPEARKAHEGTLMLMSGMYMQQKALEERQNKVEETLRRLLNKS